VPKRCHYQNSAKLGSPASSANQCQASDRKLCQRSVSAIGGLEIALRGTNWGSEDRVKITSHSCPIDRCQQPLGFPFHPPALALLSGRALGRGAVRARNAPHGLLFIGSRTKARCRDAAEHCRVKFRCLCVRARRRPPANRNQKNNIPRQRLA
jgi:hypothetical protein